MLTMFMADFMTHNAGYPFDIPNPGAGVLSYAALVYHLPLLIAFSVSQNTSFVWGGCMLFPAVHMVNDTYGIMQVRPHLPVAFRVCMYWRMINFVWGGCMLFPAAHMVNDTYGIMQVRPLFPQLHLKVYMVNDTYGITQVRPCFPSCI